VNYLRFTLLTDGSSDAVLTAHLTWLLEQHTSLPILPAWADLSRVRKRPCDLTSRVQLAVDLYPCDLLFVHRDAEREPHSMRTAEIWRAVTGVAVAVVCVVPVRMQEAWLLFDEAAIRRAAGNPCGKLPLRLPKIGDIESIADPKAVLHEALRSATELSGRRLKSFSSYQAAYRLGELIHDFSPLRVLPAFQALEEEIEVIIWQRGWQ
jgi:hypothetical protein